MNRAADRATPPSCMNAFTYTPNLVTAQIIHHHHIARRKHWAEHMVQIGQENQLFRRNGQDAPMKRGTTQTVCFRVSLDGVDRLFLRRRPSRLTQFCVRVQLIATPFSARILSRNWAMVMSAWASTKASI